MGDTWKTMHTYTNYSSPDPTTADEAWDKFVINGFVALPNAWAADRRWPPGRVMPGNTDKGIYVVDGFHQLHCLVRAQQPFLVHTLILIPVRCLSALRSRTYWTESRCETSPTPDAISTIATMLSDNL